MVFVNPRMKNEEIYDIYKQDYFIKEGYTFDDYGYGNYDLTAHLRDKTFMRWYDGMESNLLLKTGMALDVGCATGRFLKLLAGKGWDVKGIELDRGMFEMLRKQGKDVDNTPLEFYHTDRKFRLITVFDVVEHLPEPGNDIKKLSEILDDKGSIVIVTPDIDSLQRKIFCKRWFQFKPKEHISYFSKDTIERIVKPFGLKIVHVSSCGQYADFGFINHRLNRYKFFTLASVFKAFISLLGLKDRKSTRLNSSHIPLSRMPSSA